MSAFIFGLGYSARASVRAMREHVDPELQVAGTTRTRDKADQLMRERIRVHAFDGRAPGLMLEQDLLNAEQVLISIPPRDGVEVVLAHHQEALAKSEQLNWLCYFSTIAVYADANGAWIDENAPLDPTTERGQARIAVENEWRRFAARRKIPLTIFRISGIYGPGRSTFDKLRSGKAKRIVKEGQVFNRIHVDDIARFTALAARERLDGIYNLADDEPAPPQEVVTFASELSGMPAPQEVAFEKAEMSDMARSFYQDCKRVSNAAIKKKLGAELIYPTYRQGLESIFDQEVRS